MKHLQLPITPSAASIRNQDLKMTNRSISQEERMKLEFENLNNNREDETTGI